MWTIYEGNVFRHVFLPLGMATRKDYFLQGFVLKSLNPALDSATSKRDEVEKNVNYSSYKQCIQMPFFLVHTSAFCPQPGIPGRNSRTLPLTSGN